MIVQTSRRHWVNTRVLRTITVEPDKYDPDRWVAIGTFEGGKIVPLGPLFKTEDEACEHVNQLLDQAWEEA